MAASGGTSSYFDNIKMSAKQKLFLILLIAGTFFEQMDLYNYSAIAPALKTTWNLSMEQVGHIHGAFAIGSAFGAVFFGWLADKKGRKTAMTLAIFIGGLGALLSAFAPNYEFLIFTRIFAAIGVTGALIIEAPFLVEMVPSGKRSTYQGILGLIAVLGIPVSAFCAKMILANGIENWRFVAALPGISILVGVLFLIFVPESPRWLVSNGRVEEGKKVFKHITGRELLIDPDFQCIVDKPTYGEALRIMFSKEYFKRTVLFGFIYIILYNAGYMVLQWIPTLLTQEGMSIEQALGYQQMATLAMVAAPFYVMLFGDKGGRKYPYALALSFVAVGLFSLATASTVNTQLLTISVIIIGGFYAANQLFASIYSSECFPTRVRVIIIGMYFIVQKAVNVFAHGTLAPKLYEVAGFSGYFTTIGFVYIAVIVAILLLGPKTAGKTLEELNNSSTSKAA